MPPTYAGESKHIEAAACEQELGRLDREACEAFSHAQAAASASGNAFLPSRSALAAANGYLAAAAKLLELGLPQLAADALEHVPTLRQSAALPAVVAESTQLRVRALAGLGEWASVQAALKPMLRGTDVSPGSLIAAQTLSARAGYAQGNADVAIREYQTLLNHILNTAGQQGLSEVDLSDFLNLAKCYESRGDNAHALDVYTLAAAAQPGAAVLWRCAGRCQVELGELQAADLSLSEANVLDPEEPSAWGLLALVALRCGRQEDARKALK